MHERSKIESSTFSDLNRVIGWFLTLRWIACAGVLCSLLVIRLIFHYDLTYAILFILNALLFLANLTLTVYHVIIKGKNLSRNELRMSFNIQVCLDYILLFLLSYFTGFLENPICYYFVFHIMLTSFIFSSFIVYVYVSGLLFFLITVMVAEYFRIIPHFALSQVGSATYHDQLLIRGIGLCTTLIITAYLITSIKKRIEERGREIEIELDRYKSLDTIKSNFLLQVTHEIRGPIAALKGFHEMILKGITGENNPRTINTIRKADRRTGNLLTIVDEMIDYAYMTAEQRIKYDRAEIRIKEVVDSNIDLFSSLADEKEIGFASNCPKGLIVKTSRDLMNIILSNLISNAIRYSPPKSTVTVNAEKNDDNLHIMVKDEGIGIQADELDKIFEEFYRTRRAREIERDGTGLGLPIVQKAVESLEGKISVYSEEGMGTTFHIYFPLFNQDPINDRDA
jgi:signal transduction histidine kinase